MYGKIPRVKKLNIKNNLKVKHLNKENGLKVHRFDSEYKSLFYNYQKLSSSIPSLEVSSHTYLKASMTLEAVVIIPLFICFMVSLMFFFRVLEAQVSIEQALQYTARASAALCYDQKSDRKNEADLEKETKEESNYLLEKLGVFTLFELKLKEYYKTPNFVNGGLMGINLLRSDLDNDYVILRADYSMKLPITIFGKKTINFTQCVEARKWIGDESIIEGEAEDSDEWVFVTPTGKAYHITKDCNYLDLSISGAEEKSVGSERNKSGAKYKRCPYCGKVNGTGKVYITDYGEYYHRSLSCSSLKRTVYVIRLSKAEDEGRSKCSKCGD